uniref:Zinc finger protein 516 n=1 Tax=Iconisemion striatum TaxID=60296 RepID=A0A1A7WLS0_9TELE
METEEREDTSPKQTAALKAESEDDAVSCHTCGVCGRSFPLLSSLSQHMRRHTREKPYKCPYCEHRTAQKGSLKAHIRSHKLGLLSQKPSDKEAEGDQEKKANPDTPALPEVTNTPGKVHKINGKVKKKAAKKKVKSEDGVEAADAAESGPFSCTICGQVFPQVLLLKSHVKRHRGSQDHGCRICGKRFRQAWFLQSHMRIHRVKAQLRGGKGNEPPATINGIPQEPASLTNEECLYELCSSCGNFFYDRRTLRVHEKLHKLTQNPLHKDIKASELQCDKKRFLKTLNLTSAGSKKAAEGNVLSGRIVELDPICSYQAWQLATRGRLVEATEKCLGWEERLADAEVAYDTEKGEYVPLKPEKKRKQIDSTNSNVKKKKGDAVPEHTSNPLAHAKGGDKKICQKDRILLNGLGHAFYEALHKKTVKDVQLSKSSKSIRSQEKEDKNAYVCEHCDFHTVDSSLLRSHLYSQHLGSYSKHSTAVDNISKSGSRASRYMDYLRSRSLLLSQPYWNAYTFPPGQEIAEGNSKEEISDGGDVKGEGLTNADAGSLLNLSSLTDGNSNANYPVKTDGLVQHQCLYCSHTTHYPEVLWIHQRVSHRVNGNSTVAPKWAPCVNTTKGLKAGASQWRRTGPPPFLEGKDCPALPAPRTQRTRPPGVTTHSSSSKHSAPKAQQGIQKSKHHTKESRSSEGRLSSGRVQPQRTSGEHQRVVLGGSTSSSGQSATLTSSLHSKSFDGSQPSHSPKLRADRAAVESIFPHEGLGFMLARNQGGTSSNPAADRLHSRRQSWDFSAGRKGPDLWAAMNMWGLHGGKAYSDPLLFAQGKGEPMGQTPKDIDILSFLKSYSPQDLASLYQHWGFVDRRLDPQAMLQLNGHFGNEVHSSSEASKQMNSHSASSSGSIHKGT